MSDGGGVKRAAVRPVVGAGKVARFYLGGSARAGAAITCASTAVNGDPALAVYLDGEFDGVMALRVVDGRITGLYYVRNPEKLTRFTAETPSPCGEPPAGRPQRTGRSSRTLTRVVSTPLCPPGGPARRRRRGRRSCRSRCR